jgi:rhamnogalacturonyl hydrolase YesR
LKSIIREAINDAANYASDVLLDEEGKSRCDYNIMLGKWYPYEPAWHTGQIIFGLVEAYKITKNQRYLENAKRAGNWWLSLEIKDHPKLNGMVRTIHGDGIEFICFTTMTDGANGLFELWRATGDERYASVLTKAGEWSLKNMYNSERRMFYDFADPTTGEVLKKWSPFWPEKNEQTMNDVARPNNEGYLFRDMFEFTKNDKYKTIFIDLCESLIEKQGSEGLWMDFTPNNKGKGTFHPRFNLWYAESLIKGYELTNDKRYLDAAKKTLAFYTKYQKKDGTIFYENFLDGRSNESSPSGSTVAFAGILWIQLVKHGVGDEFKGSIEKSFRWVTSNRFSRDHPDKNLAGAIYNLRTRTKANKLWVVQRDVGTSFGLRFLAAYYRYKFKAEK